MKRVVIGVLLVSSCFAQDMVSFPGGNFTIGSSDGEADEQPAHTVTISPYKLDKAEVTNAEYAECVKNGNCTPPHYFDGKCYQWSSKGLQKTAVPAYFMKGSRPVVCVSWDQAKAYCHARGKRLPTEAEWEYAATAKGTKEYSIPTTPTSKTAQFQSQATAPTETFPAGYGQLKDMCGNVWEWVQDRYDQEYYSYAEEKNPRGPQVGRFRVIRGGGWSSTVKQLRGRNRHWFAPEAAEVSIGFRCADN